MSQNHVPRSRRRFTQRRRQFERRPTFRRLLHEHLENRHLLAAWAFEPSLIQAVGYHPHVEAIGDKVYVAGGNDGTTGAVNTLQVLDTTTSTWSTAASMPGRRYDGASAVINDKLYVAGGWNFPDSGIPTNTLQIYDPVTNAWSFGPTIPGLSGCGAGDAIGNRFYLLTACVGFGGYFKAFGAFDASTNSWVDLPDPSAVHADGAAGVIGGKLYIVGGGTDPSYSPSNVLEVYDPATNGWSTLAPMPTARIGMAGAVRDGRLFVIGGTNGGGDVNVVEAYDPATNTWTTEVSLNTSRRLLDAATIGNTIYAVGGFTANVPQTTVESLGSTPTTNTAPEITSLSVDQAMIFENDSVTLDGGFTDPNAGDEHTVTINWGDGNVQVEALTVGARSFSFAHQYLDDGVSPGNGTTQDDYTVLVTISDNNGGSDSSSSGGGSWTQLVPTGGPPVARQSTAAVYDEATNQMIVFGGLSGSTIQNDLWRLSSANGDSASQWTPVSVSGTVPSPRWVSEAAYDSDTNRMIVHGGSLGFASPVSNQTWVLTNANGTQPTPSTWSLISSSGPAPRFNHSAAYDDVNDRLIVFAGSNGFSLPSFGADVWVLSDADGIGTPTWTQLAPIGSIPDRGGHEAVYDPGSNRMIVFGGSNNNGTPVLFNDVRVLTNANGLGGTPQWINITPASGPAPAPRGGFDMVYDADDNRLIVFGGSSSAGRMNDTWILTHANGIGGTPEWIEINPTGTLPAPVNENSLMFDTANDRIITFAGTLNGSPSSSNQVWTLGIDGGIASPTLTVKNVNPVGADQLYTTNEDAPLNINVLAGTDDSGPFTVTDQGTLDTHTAVAGTYPTAQGGSVTIAANGDATYTPATDFFGTDSFDFTVMDDDAGSDIATVTIIVLSAAQQTEQLVEDVQALLDNAVLNNGQGNPLLNFLNQALKDLSKGKVSQAVKKLNDFIGRVQGLVNSGKLTVGQGQPLIDAANAAIASAIPGAPLLASEGGNISLDASNAINPMLIPSLLRQASAYWQSHGLVSDSQLQQIRNIQIHVADLPPRYLGAASSTEIWLDRDGAGYGWSVSGNSGGERRMDLLSVFTHELGHAIGLDHSDDYQVMVPYLSRGHNLIQSRGITLDLASSSQFGFVQKGPTKTAGTSIATRSLQGQQGDLTTASVQRGLLTSSLVDPLYGRTENDECFDELDDLLESNGYRERLESILGEMFSDGEN